MRILQALIITTSFAAMGCAATQDREVFTQAPTDVVETSGYAIRQPAILPTSSGTRFHGSVCKRSSLPPPTRIRVERLGAGGEVLASASSSISGLSGRVRHCAFYDVSADWTIGSGERARVCAGRSDAACPTSSRPDFVARQTKD